MNEIKMF